MMRNLFLVLTWSARLLLTAFFLFVGYWKALGPPEALVEHHAWVAGFPLWFARTVGWSEIALGACLPGAAIDRARRVASVAGIALIVNQLIALAVHLSRQETGAIPQNLVVVALLVLVTLPALRANRHASTL